MRDLGGVALFLHLGDSHPARTIAHLLPNSIQVAIRISALHVEAQARLADVGGCILNSPEEFKKYIPV